MIIKKILFNNALRESHPYTNEDNKPKRPCTLLWVSKSSIKSKDWSREGLPSLDSQLNKRIIKTLFNIYEGLSMPLKWYYFFSLQISHITTSVIKESSPKSSPAGNTYTTSNHEWTCVQVSQFPNLRTVILRLTCHATPINSKFRSNYPW